MSNKDSHKPPPRSVQRESRREDRGYQPNPREGYQPPTGDHPGSGNAELPSGDMAIQPPPPPQPPPQTGGDKKS